MKKKYMWISVSDIPGNSLFNIEMKKYDENIYAIAFMASNRNFKIVFCNIRYLDSNINSVHQRLQTWESHIVAEIQIKPTLLLYTWYEFHSKIRFKYGLCVIHANVKKPRKRPNLLLKRSGQASVLSTNPLFDTFLNNISYKVIHIQETFLKAVVILGDFKVHNKNWLKY